MFGRVAAENAVDSAYARARVNGFGPSCDPAAGSLLTTPADALEFLAATTEGFDLVLADAFGGKIDGLDRTTGN